MGRDKEGQPLCAEAAAATVSQTRVWQCRTMGGASGWCSGPGGSSPPGRACERAQPVAHRKTCQSLAEARLVAQNVGASASLLLQDEREQEEEEGDDEMYVWGGRMGGGEWKGGEKLVGGRR